VSELTVCFIIGTIICVLSVPLILLMLSGALFKRVGITYMGWFSTLFLAAMPFLFYAAQLAIYKYSPQAWGVVFLPLFLGLYSLVICYIACAGTVILGKRYVYRLGYFMEPHRYDYSQVKNCIGKSDSGWIYSRGGGSKLVTHYDVVITFRDGTEGSFGVKDKYAKKARYFFRVLKNK